MKKNTTILMVIFGTICLLFAQQAQSQVYLNGPLSVRVDLFSLEGGGDWGFRSVMPGFNVSFTYKGHRIQIASGQVSEKRFSRKEYPMPTDFKLKDSEVMLDGFPATNYIAYYDYLGSLGGQIDAIVLDVDRGNEAALNKVLKDIDEKKNEINKKLIGFQVSAKFSSREHANSYIERLNGQREHFARELERLKAQQGKSTVIVGGNTSSGETKQASSDNTSIKDAAQPKTNNKEDLQFEGGLNDIKEGEYFKDNNGNYFQKVNNRAQRVEKSVYDQAQVDRMQLQLERQKSEQKEREALYNQAADEIANLTTDVIASIQADRQASWNREYESTNQAQQIIDKMSGLASEGNEEAMKQINRAYYTLAWCNKEEKGGWTGAYSNARERFLIETFRNVKSTTAQNLLIGFYEEQKESALAKKRKVLTDGIVLPLLGAGMIYGGVVGYDKLVQYEDGESTNETLGSVVLATGVVGGVTFGIWGIYELVRSFTDLGKQSDGYKEADRKQNRLKKTISWQFTPLYDAKHNAALLSFKVNF